MDVWANWVPNFQNYDWTFNLDTPNYGLTTMMAFAFRCNTVTVTKDQENQPAYIRWDSTAKKLYCLNVRISLTYSKDTYKLVKFKRKGSSGSGWPNEIRVSLTSMKMFDGQNKALDIGQRLFGGYYALIWGNNGANLNEIIFTLPIVTTSEIEFEYILELGLCKEIDEEPYYWDNKTWTPNQLKFPSMTKYSSILTENKNDTGDAVKLPETSSATNVNNYEQDENGYCYITDDEENIVYNKFLNLLARKTKINNGYRINGDQSLELLSFNNNIRNNYDKQSGQYLFNNDKKQKYGDKEDKNKINLEQNIPYFGGNPAVYPVVVYNNMESLETAQLTIIKTSNQLQINTKTWSLSNNDLVLAYVREEGGLTYENVPSSSWNFWWKKEPNHTAYAFSIKEKTNNINITTPSIKAYPINTNYVWTGSNNIFSTETTQPIFFTITERKTQTLNLDFKNISDHFSRATLTEPDFACFIGEYTYNPNEYKDIAWKNHCHLKMSCNVNYETINTILAKELIFNQGTSVNKQQTSTGDLSCYVNGEVEFYQYSEYVDIAAEIKGNFQYYPGIFPSYFSYYGNADLNITGVIGSTSKATNHIKSSSSIIDTVKIKDRNFNYSYHAQSREQYSSGTTDWNVYLDIGYYNSNYKKYAIAIVIWKNGKLLENS